MSKQRSQWGSRTGFILAAIGSAVGLGNIWRFPYVAATNGGGAFLVPYLFALLSAGIPILILEFVIAHKIKKGAAGTFGAVSRKMQIFGWFQTFISFGIMTYYTVIIGWTLNYFVYSAGAKWGEDSKGFFFGDFLHITDSPFNFGGINTSMLLALTLVWALNIIVLISGIKKGIEKANKVFMPLLVVSLLVIVVRGVTLEGAAAGLNYFFTPDFGALLKPSVWIAAYGQIFYSLSIAFGIMITYASYLPDDTDIVNNAFMTGFGNSSFSMLAGIGVFSVIGYMATTSGASVEEVASGGIGLAFIVFPQIINALPGLNSLMGMVFFSSLIFAGVSSSMSVFEVIVTSISEKFEMGRKKATLVVGAIGFACSLIFVTGAGLYILDIVDHVINNYGIAISGLIEIIFLAWYLKIDDMRKYANKSSDFQVGTWWNFTLKYLTPVLLSVMFIFNVYNDVVYGYEGYPVSALLTFGGGTMIIIIGLSLIFSLSRGGDKFEKKMGIGVKDVAVLRYVDEEK